MARFRVVTLARPLAGGSGPARLGLGLWGNVCGLDKKQRCKSGARGSVKDAESVQVSGAVLECRNTCRNTCMDCVHTRSVPSS